MGPEQVTPVSVSISGTVIDGTVEYATICLADNYLQSHRLMIWIVGFVQNGNTYAIYLGFQNDGAYPVGASTFLPFVVPGYAIDASCEALNQYSITSFTSNNLTSNLKPSDIHIDELEYTIDANKDVYASHVSYNAQLVAQGQNTSVVIMWLSIGVVMYLMVRYAKLTSSSAKMGSRTDQYVTIELNDHELDLGCVKSTHVGTGMSYQQENI